MCFNSPYMNIFTRRHNSIESWNGGTGVGQWSIKAMHRHAASLFQTRIQRCEIVWEEQEITRAEICDMTWQDMTVQKQSKPGLTCHHNRHNTQCCPPNAAQALSLGPGPSLFQPLSLPHLFLSPWQPSQQWGHSFVRTLLCSAWSLSQTLCL